ncbi:hypothetical protein CPB83DRAFT_590491 [Crepidotus variabilis]|uniref:Uncharacterized protein n=1 Tax=Crepidotus variabilis TaxID=179855 RepID=A0A9P6EQ74_9AGAR|nr:hypothetical protein CPB83DRAFT_590491 [Crepidotus variabilis]
MDNQAPATPSSSGSGSDSDTEAPRVYFGPVKTPERNFVAANKLFPPPVSSPLRRSPRLSSPRPQPNLQSELQEEEPETTAQEAEDIEHVAQLVNQVEVDDDDEDMVDSQSGTPQSGALIPDEPSSALANRILLALDNPSPPPSPPAALSIFDPYHATNPGTSNDYQEDLLLLRANEEGHVPEDDNPLGHRVTSPRTSPSQRKNQSAREELLIAFDSPNHSMTADAMQPSAVPTTPHPVLSVDDMFSQSPDVHQTIQTTDVTMHVPVLVVEGVERDDRSDSMAIDSPKQTMVELEPPTHSPAQQIQENQTSNGTVASSFEPLVEPMATPLRRSSRPRKSVIPTPSPKPIPHPVFTAPPPTTPLSIRKKSALSKPIDDGEVIEDSQDEKNDDTRLSPVRAARSRPRRSRSPSKEPPSFRRELGSLSPKSSDLLSTLAFGDNGPSSRGPSKEPPFRRELGSLSPKSSDLPSTLAFGGLEATPQPPGSSAIRSPYEPAPVFSFSVFGGDSGMLEPRATPSTPIREPSPNGPRRILSPPKAETSPAKFHLQAPTPGSSVGTPARRITMEEAIANGQISPQKAAQLGFKANTAIATPSTKVSTPARRVLISEKHPVPPPVSAKVVASRLTSPSKSLASSQREKSAEPSARLTASVKGKERAVSPGLSVESSLSKSTRQLPFPIVAAEPTPSKNEPESMATSSSNTNGNISSPSKSSLKQVSSRIPRIPAKPYARATDSKILEKKKTEPRPRGTDVSKDSPVNTTTRRSIRMVETSIKPTASSLARTKQPVASSSSITPAMVKNAVLKRKREEKPPSPPKPRVLRQVPSLKGSTSTKSAMGRPTATVTTTTTINEDTKGKKPTGGSIRIRRVVTPPVPTKPPSPPLQPPESSSDDIPSSEEAPVLIETGIPQLDLPERIGIAPPSSPPSSTQDLLPGSPMKQDAHPHTVDEDMESETPMIPPISMIPTPVIVINPPAPSPPQPEPVSSGLRRTTRQRRSTSTSGSEPQPPTSSRAATRRKAAVTFHSDDVFSGMSITALKELTTSNTTKNQHYLTARLETEVVRKDGLRPESPAVKIRTISQRQQEEKEMEREERAQRRARRNLAKGLEGDESMISGSEEAGYSSPTEVHTEGDGDVNMEGSEEEDELDEDELPRHTRGAGDEEDYETPERPLRGVKARLFDDGATQEQRRSVKWDRGLYTLVYLDEVQLGSRQTLKENRDLKGILAPAAKALRLDTLGNLVQADTPLGDLIPENVTVKKFVYDNDVVIVPEPTPPPPKNTRLKGKRK